MVLGAGWSKTIRLRPQAAGRGKCVPSSASLWKFHWKFQCLPALGRSTSARNLPSEVIELRKIEKQGDKYMQKIVSECLPVLGRSTSAHNLPCN